MASVIITQIPHDEPLTSRNSSGFWVHLTSNRGRNLFSSHHYALPLPWKHPNRTSPDAEFVVFGTKWKDDECPVNLRHCICSPHIRDCMPHVMTAWPWAGPGSASSPDLVLTFHRSIQIFSGRKRKSEMFHEIFETLSSQARNLLRNTKIPIYIIFYIFVLTLG